MDLVDTIHASHAHEVREEGWVDMKNERLYGREHQYFHEKFSTIETFSGVHFGDANTAWQYLAEHCKNRRKPQEVHFDMERNCKADHLKCFPAIIDESSDLRSLRLSFYENEHLDIEQFKEFMQSVAKLKKLKKLDINLRWCKQVTDDWMHIIGMSPHERIEEVEIWVYNCHRVTDWGVKKLMEGLKRCEKLKVLKLYLGETKVSSRCEFKINDHCKDRGEKFQLRVVCDHFDINTMHHDE